MTQDELIQEWKQAEQEPFTGWNFAHLEGRMIEDPVPWSYMARAGELLRRSTAVIDIDTGGGERLLELQAAWPQRVAATEGYPPNVKLATEHLTPWGVEVFDIDISAAERLPFADGEFDLILNRHGAMNPPEFARILGASGTFFTQQVHGLSYSDLQAAFAVEPQAPEETLEKYVPLLQNAGFRIVQAEDWSGRSVLIDVAALVYYLKAIPWTVPDFSVESHLVYLLRLQEKLDRGDSLVFTTRRYLIEAQRA